MSGAGPAAGPDTAGADTAAAGPVRILQVGGGVFLRGFLDWMVDVARAAGAFDGTVAVALSTDPALAGRLRAQELSYTVLLRGLHNGRTVEEPRLVRAISDVFGFEQDWHRAVSHACSPDLRAIVSNTTERGLEDHPEPRPPADRAPRSFPARLAALLHARRLALGEGPDSALLALPCELVADNGPVLRRLVLAHAERWQLGSGFASWLDARVRFLSTLVDRIVSGFPHDDAEQLFAAWGRRDPLCVVAEPFHLWAIEGDAEARARLPLHRAGLDVLWTNDLTPWRESKLRVLNGGHVVLATAGLLLGLDTVGQAMRAPALRRFLERVIADEILPGLPLPPADARAYADRVIERFDNPFLHHALRAIAIGALDKARIRLLPSLRDGYARTGVPPARLATALAVLLRFSRGEPGTDGWHGTADGRRHPQRDDGRYPLRDDGRYPLRDDDAKLARVAEAWADGNGDPAAVASRALGDPALWGEDLRRIPGLADAVAAALARIERRGVADTLAHHG